MARAVRSKFKDASSEVIEKNFLEENPEGFESTERGAIVITKYIPKMETIIFRNERDPGIPLEFHYHSKTHPLKHYTLYHGQEHTLPVEVIEHLESCAVPIYAYKRDMEGKPQMYRQAMRHQFTCKTVRK